MSRHWLLVLLMWVCGHSLMGQDASARQAPADHLLAWPDSMPLMRAFQRCTLPIPDIRLPEQFQNLSENQLTDASHVLAPFLEKMQSAVLRQSAADTIRILHIGDSHIRGHILPLTVADSLSRLCVGLAYTHRGINGATTATFSAEKNRSQLQVATPPDLLILSFGTNESHNRRYDSSLHYRQMGDLVRLLREAMPTVPILMTTPPGAYQSSGRRKSRTYQVNPRTDMAVQTMLRFAQEYGIAVWDLYNICGGSDSAATNWHRARLMRPDRVHFVAGGYILQGQLLYQAIIKGYNDHVAAH